MLNSDRRECSESQDWVGHGSVEKKKMKLKGMIGCAAMWNRAVGDVISTVAETTHVGGWGSLVAHQRLMPTSYTEALHSRSVSTSKHTSRLTGLNARI